MTLAPVIMKRGRPGIILTCLAAPAQLDRILDVLFQETTTFGSSDSGGDATDSSSAVCFGEGAWRSRSGRKRSPM